MKEYENGSRVMTLRWLSPVDGRTAENCVLEAGSVGTVLCHVTAGLVDVQMDAGPCVVICIDNIDAFVATEKPVMMGWAL